MNAKMNNLFVATFMLVAGLLGSATAQAQNHHWTGEVGGTTYHVEMGWVSPELCDGCELVAEEYGSGYYINDGTQMIPLAKQDGHIPENVFPPELVSACKEPVEPDSQQPLRANRDNCPPGFLETPEQFDKRMAESSFCKDERHRETAACKTAFSALGVTPPGGLNCSNTESVNPAGEVTNDRSKANMDGPRQIPAGCEGAESNEDFQKRMASSDYCKKEENKGKDPCKSALDANPQTVAGGDAAGDGTSTGGSDSSREKVPESIPGLATPGVLIPGGEANGPLRSEGIMSGTDPYKRCQRLMTSSKKWSDSVGVAQNDSQTSIFSKSWQVLFEEHKEKIVAKANENQGKDIDHNVKANLAKVFQAAVDAASTQYKYLNACVGLLMVTDDADNYSDEELKGVKDGNMTKKSMDGKIECKAAGPETQDWSACKTLLTTYNAAAIGQVVTQEAQKLDYMDKELDTQTDLMADGGKDPTKALKSQETMVRKQAQIANQRAAFHGAKLAALMAAKEAMPTKDGIYGECTSSNNIQSSVGLLRKQYHHYVGALKNYAGELVGSESVDFKLSTGTTDSGTNSSSTQKLTVNLQGSFSEAFPDGNADVTSLPDPDAAAGPAGDKWAYEAAGGNQRGQKFSDKNSVCDAAIYDGTNVIMNSKAIEQANMAMIQAGVDMAANVAKGQILDNQADRIADAADGIKQFDPGEMPMFQEEDAKVTACQADPTSAECLQLENTRGVGYAGSSFNFNGASRATTPGQISDDGDGSGDSSASSSNTNRGDVKSKMGRGIASINKGGGLDGIAGKAGVKKGGNPAEAGGGGGGGGGGAAPPSGGGVTGGGGAGGAKSAYSANKVRYRGGAGGLSFSGSGRGSSSSKKKSDNPFASLLGKKGGKSGTMDGFRNPASIGAKGGSLFQMISKRYSVVAEKKQLLEYEDVK